MIMMMTGFVAVADVGGETKKGRELKNFFFSTFLFP